MTPILIACERALNDVVKVLVEYGADVNAQDEVLFFVFLIVLKLIS